MPSDSPVRNARQRMGAATMLAEVPDRSATLAFFDPQYRGVLDKMKFGNEGARQKGRALLPQMGYAAIRAIAGELARVLKPSGNLCLWVDKFTVAEGHHRGWLGETGLKVVELIHWNKGRMGMGRRARCRSEYLVIAQKPPTRAWRDHGIEDTWLEQSDRSGHPHAKPLALQQRLIREMTKRGDLVVDPCAGGYGVLEACRATGRQFMGCDIAGEHDGQGKAGLR